MVASDLDLVIASYLGRTYYHRLGNPAQYGGVWVQQWFHLELSIFAPTPTQDSRFVGCACEEGVTKDMASVFLSCTDRLDRAPRTDLTVLQNFLFFRQPYSNLTMDLSTCQRRQHSLTKKKRGVLR